MTTATKPTSHPSATGRAAQTVAEHAEKEDLVLWAAWFCPFSQRSWIALEEEGLKYQYKEVNPYAKPVELLDINAKGLVPILQNTFTKEVTTDSLAILRHLQSAGSSPAITLLPSSPADQAIATKWLAHIDTVLIPSYFRLLQAQPSNTAQSVKALEEFAAAISLLSAARNAAGPFFFGKDISLVDIAIAPWSVRDFILTEFRGWKRESVPGWMEWAEVLEKRESVVKTTSNRDKYVEFNETFLKNESFSQAAKAARDRVAIP